MTHLYSAASVDENAHPSAIFDALSHQVEAMQRRVDLMGDSSVELVPGSLTLEFKDIGDPEFPRGALVLEATIIERETIAVDVPIATPKEES